MTRCGDNEHFSSWNSTWRRSRNFAKRRGYLSTDCVPVTMIQGNQFFHAIKGWILGPNENNLYRTPVVVINLSLVLLLLPNLFSYKENLPPKFRNEKFQEILPNHWIYHIFRSKMSIWQTKNRNILTKQQHSVATKSDTFIFYNHIMILMTCKEIINTLV